MDEATGRLTSLERGAEFAGYRIEGMLDRGGMGVVYKATDPDLHRTVALKIIAPEHTQNEDAVARFKVEARLAASLEHPNIVPIHRGGEVDGVLYLAMRYVPGTNLRQVVDQGQLDMDRITLVMTSVGAALDAAHERGLVHRDVKPANILISQPGDVEHEHVYLTDFGLTKRLGTAGSLTRTGAWVGTPDYVAPEQIQAGRVDGRADIYSLGCVLYEMLTGSVAFPRENDMAKLWAHVSDQPPNPTLKRPELVKSFDEVVARATSKDPDARYARASELAAAALGAIAEQKTKLTPGALQPTRAPAVPPVAPSTGRDEVFIAEPTYAPGPPASAPGAPASAGAGDTIAPPPQPPSAGQQTVPPEPPPSSGGSGAAAPPSAGPAPPSPPRRNPRVALVLAVLAAAVAAVVAFVVVGGGDDEKQPSSIAATPVAATKLPGDLDWGPIRDAPFRRQYAASTAVGGKVWVIGGIGVRTSSTTTKAYDPGTDTWTTGPGLPLPLHHFSAVTYRDEPVVIGGFVPGAELTSKQSDRVYALRGDTWEELPPLNHARAAAAAAVVGDKIVVVGGQANGKLVPETEVFDGESWKDVAAMPTPREHLGAASDGRYLYAVGGRELAADKNLPALERYDPGSDSWTELKDMPEASGAVGAGYAGGRIVAVGGESTTSASDSVLGYDIQKQTWSQLPNLPSPRHGVAVTSLKNVIYAIGGATAAGHVDSTNAAEVLDLSGGKAARSVLNAKWRAIRTAPFRTQYAASTAVGGRVWLFGGIGANDKGTADTAVFDRALNIWTRGPKLPSQFNHFSAVTYRDEPVVIGGFVPGAELTSKQSDRVYALRGDTWEELPPLNHARAAAAAAVVGDKIVVVGGQANGKLVPETEVFDGESWKDVAAMPTPREHLGAASDGRYLYAVGGRELAADKNLPALERYDPGSDSWTELKDMPEASGAVGAGYAGGRIVAVGGESTTSASDSVLGYDIQKQTWSQLPNLPSPRHGVAVTSLKNVIYAIGGATAAGHVQATAVANVLDLG